MNGYRMRELRHMAGLRQVEVAPELGLKHDTIYRWEKTNKEIPRVYAEAFERLVNDLERCAWIKRARLARRQQARSEKIARAEGSN